MEQSTVGIGNIATYIPEPRIELSTIVERRIAQDPSMARRLKRAVVVTGQEAMRYPQAFEDSASLAGNAVYRLLTSPSINDAQLAKIRYLVAGTETTVDHSKPLSSYVGGMVQRAGVQLPNSLTTFQVQHACAGGTLGILSVAGLLSATPDPEERGIVVSSDIARYAAPSTAEITQGAGAAAMLIEKNPRLIELDITTQGYASHDVDDFFRPLGSTIAKVKGSYSVQCYHEAAEQAFRDHCNRRGETAKEVLLGTDMFVFHVPFAKMGHMAAKKLLGSELGMFDGEADEFLAARGFFDALEATAQVGNVYTASAYLNLATLLYTRYQQLGDAIVGKKILLASYGSGNTMVVISGKVAAGAPDIIKTWDLGQMWQNHKKYSFDNYVEWLHRDFSPHCYNSRVDSYDIPKGLFHLASIREDGLREYAIKL